MIKNKYISLAIIILILITQNSCKQNNEIISKTEIARIRALFKPLPRFMTKDGQAPNEHQVILGKKLFFETELSSNSKTSCNSCHNLDTFGVDNKKTSPGHLGKLGKRNSPTVYNAALHISQFWDGRAVNVEEQAISPILNSDEMGMLNKETILKRLRSISEYQELFNDAFPETEPSLTIKHIGIAIGAFERTLVTPSRFDKFLAGDDSALNKDEISGLKLFQSHGCIACHTGPGIGGSMYQKLGIAKKYETEDLGRFEITKNEADKYVFKVPSLRNITKTKPYLHDGSIESLPEVVKIMGKHQLGKEISDKDSLSIIKFLDSLTGDIQDNH